MAVVALQANERLPKGKGGARQLRREGRIPAILYGPGEEPLPLSLDSKEVELLFRKYGGGSIILELSITGERDGKGKALLREVQRHTVTGKVLHIDLQHISPTRKVTLDVPVVVVGESVGAKAGGVQEVVMRDIQVQCLPADIPEKIEIDVSEMQIGDSIHVRDLTIPNVEVLRDPESVIVTVVPPTVYEEVKEEKPAEEPELVAKEKEEAEAEAEAEGKEVGKEKTRGADKE